MTPIIKCPKFQTCNAAICPLDAEWHKRSNQSSDSTCFYLIESVKHNAKANFEIAQQIELYQSILRVRDAIIERHGRIKTKLESASKSGSRMARVIRGKV